MKLVQHHADRGDLESSAEAKRGGEHRLARTGTLEPRSKHRRRQAEKNDGNAEHPANRAELPIVRCRGRDTDALRQRQVEDAERVRLTDREMDRERRGRHEPSRIPRARDGPITIEK